MKRILIILLICFLAGSKVQAQKDVLVLPDSLGRYMYELFINRATLEQTELKIDNLEPDPFGFRIDPISTWKLVITKAESLGLNASNTRFDNTYYRINQEIGGDNKLAQTHYLIYVAMHHDGAVYAFNFGASFTGTAWSISEIEPTIYSFEHNYFNEVVLDGIGDILEVADASAEDSSISGDAETEVILRKDFKPSVQLNNPVMSSPLLFVEDVYTKLMSNKTLNIAEQGFGEKEFNQICAPTMRLLVNKEMSRLDDPSSEDLELAKRVLANPYAYYTETLTTDWNNLSEYFKDNWNISGKGTPQDAIKIISISNWNEDEVLAPNLEIEARIEVKIDDLEEGLRFFAIRTNDKWKLRYVQGSTYAIMGALTELDEE